MSRTRIAQDLPIGRRSLHHASQRFLRNAGEYQMRADDTDRLPRWDAQRAWQALRRTGPDARLPRRSSTGSGTEDSTVDGDCESWRTNRSNQPGFPRRTGRRRACTRPLPIRRFGKLCGDAPEARDGQGILPVGKCLLAHRREDRPPGRRKPGTASRSKTIAAIGPRPARGSCRRLSPPLSLR